MFDAGSSLNDVHIDVNGLEDLKSGGGIYTDCNGGDKSVREISLLGSHSSTIVLRAFSSPVNLSLYLRCLPALLGFQAHFINPTNIFLRAHTSHVHSTLISALLVNIPGFTGSFHPSINYCIALFLASLVHATSTV